MEECKWLHYGPGHRDKPCCYHNDMGGQASTDVCDPNLADEKTCRTDSEVGYYGDECSLNIKDPDERDIGEYLGYMPYIGDREGKPHSKQTVTLDDLNCSHWVSEYCITICNAMQSVLFVICCAPIVLVAVVFYTKLPVN